MGLHFCSIAVSWCQIFTASLCWSSAVSEFPSTNDKYQLPVIIINVCINAWLLCIFYFMIAILYSVDVPQSSIDILMLYSKLKSLFPYFVCLCPLQLQTYSILPIIPLALCFTAYVFLKSEICLGFCFWLSSGRHLMPHLKFLDCHLTLLFASVMFLSTHLQHFVRIAYISVDFNISLMFLKF